MARVQSALGDMMISNKGLKNGNRRHTSVPHLSSASLTSTFGTIDLSGYALHQRLRTAPGTEMYVTGIQARVIAASRDATTAESSLQGVAGDPSGNGDSPWARVDGCRYDPLGNTLEARMRFGRTLMVSGSVRLLYGGVGGGNRIGGAGVLPGETGCDMTLRLRPRAGLEFTAVPLTMPEKSPPNRLTATPTMTIRTTATFIDPEPIENDPGAAYVSVHSYNCVGAAAGLSGNNNYHREQPSASSDRFEQFLSSGDNGGNGGGDANSDSDELLSGGGSSGEGTAGADIEIDMNDDEGGGDDGGGGGTESTEFSDKHNSRWRRPFKSSSSVENTPPNNLFSPAGFVSPSLHLASNPEPRLRRIQYHTKKSSQSQHPLLTVAAAVNNHHQPTQDQLLVEMEDVFVKGVRSLLAKHMERSLKHVLKDSLMANMGYTVSYG